MKARRKRQVIGPNDVYVELSEDLEKIEVKFRFREADVRAVKEIGGRRWDEERRLWTVPLTLIAARKLRMIFEDRMKLGPAMRMWAREQVKYERNLRQLNAADDADLEQTPQVILDVIAGLPFEHPTVPKRNALRRKRPARPYQRADIKLMAIANAINANDVGTGKTIEVIGSIYEAGLEDKPVLVIGPRRSLVNVWQTEFDRFSDIVILTSENPSDRKGDMTSFPKLLKKKNRPRLALALIADDIRVEQYYKIKSPKPEHEDPLHACRDIKGNWYRFRSEAQKALYDIDWGFVIIDEFHATGLPNRYSLFSLSAALLKSERRVPMSATPIGGKPKRLWPILNFIEPDTYKSEWAWIDDFLEVTEEKVYVRGGGGSQRTVKKVGGIKPGTEEEFFNHHRMHMVRRVKKDALPGLPDAVEILVETPMTGRQLEEYRQFEDEHEILLEGGRLSGSIVLAQYTRMRQMANSRLGFDKNGQNPHKPIALPESQKLDYLLERLDENGIRKTDYEPGARAYVGVNDRSFLTVVLNFLQENGIACDRLDGGTKDSKPLIDRFNGPDEQPYVIVMTIKTGGTALSLDAAGSAHALDEEWDPDIMTQFWGRGDRGARETALKCYTYRTPESIQEYVAEVAEGKTINNKTVLSVLREIEAMRHGEEE